MKNFKQFADRDTFVVWLHEQKTTLLYGVQV